MSYRRTTDFEERDYMSAPRREYDDGPPRGATRTLTRDDGGSFVRTREGDRMPAFLREDGRRTEAGPVILRREVESVDIHRDRSPSPVRYREERLVRRPRSDSPQSRHGGHEHERVRVIEKERVRSPSLPRARSPSPRAVRFVERPRSPTVDEREHIHTRIVETERERIPSPSPSPPPVVRGPTIEREVITHYTDVDHGTIHARRPSPAPAPKPRYREDQRETDIDISLSKNRTEVDIHERRRSRSRDPGPRYRDNELVVRQDQDFLRIDDSRRSRRRAHSAAPSPSAVNEEADYIAGRIDSRGRMGEAWGGATRDWSIVDVPPGTERVRMDGVGGGSTDTTWSRYSGVRRTKFIPERDGVMVPVERERERERERTGRNRLSVSIHEDRRISKSPKPPPPAPTREMWTEITKDLVSREAIQTLGYRYEETKWFYYIMEYLPYDEVLRLIEFSEEIRRSRRDRARELEWERDWIRDWDRRHRRHNNGRARSRSRSRRRRSYGWDEERTREMEVIVDDRRPAGGYYYY